MWNKVRVLFLVFLDIMLVNGALLIAYNIRFFDTGVTTGGYFRVSILFCADIVYLLSFFIFKLYRRVWSYASTGEVLAIINAVSVGTLGTITVTYLLRITMPRSVILMTWAFIIIFIGGSRFAWRLYIEKKKGNGLVYGRKALIVGAGDAGAMVARELSNSRKTDLRPIGFIDDDPAKRNLSILGIPVLGNREDIPQLINKNGIDEIIIAMPSVSGQAIREIVEICRNTRANIKVLPGVYEIIDGRVSFDRIRPLQLEDLLHREPVNLDLAGIADNLKGRVVLITGAGGSIGSELCRQIAIFEPKRLIILGHGENSIHKIWLELKHSFPDLEVVVEIADIRDSSRIDYLFKKHGPDVVFHAAAHKHVPLMEMHPDEAIKTNIGGTRNVAEAAHRSKAKIFVMISTDKAVNPSSVMGATKLFAELIIRYMNSQSNTIYTAVRFGNVLGSNGSVVNIFRQQIRQGGPVTVTHSDMTRFFMTIPEAVSLVIQAGSMAKGGEVFLLDMGEPVKIVDLACDMIRLSGYEPEKDIEIIFTGIRPGEKLYEELLTDEETATATCHKKIFTAKPCQVDANALKYEIVNLENLSLNAGCDEIFRALERVIPEFNRFCSRMDEDLNGVPIVVGR